MNRTLIGPALRRASPWLALVALLYGSQLWAVFDSEFTMPVTLLQVPFVLAFMATIVAIAYHRELEITTLEEAPN